MMLNKKTINFSKYCNVFYNKACLVVRILSYYLSNNPAITILQDINYQILPKCKNVYSTISHTIKSKIN